MYTREEEKKLLLIEKCTLISELSMCEKNLHLRPDTTLKKPHFYQLLAISQRKTPHSLCKPTVRPACFMVNLTEEKPGGRKGRGKDEFNISMDEILDG